MLGCVLIISEIFSKLLHTVLRQWGELQWLVSAACSEGPIALRVGLAPGRPGLQQCGPCTLTTDITTRQLQL